MAKTNQKTIRPQTTVKYLLDSDVIIWLLRNNKKFISSYKKLVKNQYQAISVVSIGEIYKNLFPSESQLTERFFQANQTMDLDYQTAKLAGLFWRDYHKDLKSLSITDCFIAATAKLNNLTLLTCNTRHFPMVKTTNPFNLPN